MDNVIKLVRVVEGKEYHMTCKHKYNTRAEAQAFIDGYEYAIDVMARHASIDGDWFNKVIELTDGTNE